MDPVYGLLVALSAIGLCHSCSPPAPGTPPPTVAELVQWADVVAVGKVLEITADPAEHSWESTYGAKVEIQCSYKGGPLPGVIKIGNAGYIPGHCDDMALIVDQKVILLLDNPSPGVDFYTQTSIAVVHARFSIAAFLKVCGMDMRYPTVKLPDGSSMIPRRESCDAVRNVPTCTGPKGNGEYEETTPDETTAVEEETTATETATTPTVRVEKVLDMKTGKTSGQGADDSGAITTSAQVGMILLALVVTCLF